jgi:putative transposase
VQEIAQEGILSIPRLCRLFGYSKQAYYKRKSPPTVIAPDLLRTQIMTVRSKLPRLGVRKLHFMIDGNLKSLGVNSRTRQAL